MTDRFTTLHTYNTMIQLESFIKPLQLKCVIGINLLISHKPNKSLSIGLSKKVKIGDERVIERAL